MRFPLLLLAVAATLVATTSDASAEGPPAGPSRPAPAVPFDVLPPPPAGPVVVAVPRASGLDSTWTTSASGSRSSWTAASPGGVRPPSAPPSAAAGKSGEAGGGEDLAQKLQNPVAALISVPLQGNFDFGYGTENAMRFTLNVQPVIPISLGSDWNLISRTIFPIIYREAPTPGTNDEAGIGDILQSAFFSPKDPRGGPIWGAGPVLLFPTATEDALGGGRWAAGPTGVVLQQMGPWTVGMLANHLWSFAGDDNRPGVNATFLQPFAAYSFPSSLSVSLSTEATYDWEGDQWTVPINLSLSQVTRVETRPISLSMGVRWYAEAPEGGPEWGLKLGITFLFPK